MKEKSQNFRLGNGPFSSFAAQSHMRRYVMWRRVAI